MDLFGLKYSSWKDTRGALAISVFLYITGIAILLVFGEYQATYILGWVGVVLGYSYLLYLFIDRRIFRASKEDQTRYWLLIFFSALFLRTLFLLKYARLSPDIYHIADKGQKIKEGQIPYRDFETIYPPFHYWILAILSPFSRGEIISGFFLDEEKLFFYSQSMVIVLKMVYIIADAWISILVIILYQQFEKEKKDLGLAVGFGYALNPISIVEVGWMGHFDALVMCITLIGVILYFNSNYRAAAIPLAVGTMMKWFPGIIFLVLAGELFRKENKREMVLFGGVYFIIIAVISLPFLLLAPKEFLTTILLTASSGGNVYDSYSLTSGLKWIVYFSFLTLVPESICKFLVTSVFYSAILIFIGHFALSNRFERIELRMAQRTGFIVVFGLLLLFGLGHLVVGAFMYFPINFFGLPVVLLAYLGLKKEMDRKEEFIENFREAEGIRTVQGSSWNLLVIIWLSVVFMMLATATWHPWYALWSLSFALVILPRIPSLRMYIFLILLACPLAYGQLSVYFNGLVPSIF